MNKDILLSTDFILAIDTNSFSDHFYKQLCAYCTGFTDENDTARDFADLFYLDEQIEDDDSPKGKVADEKNIFYGFVSERLDEDQVYSPCCVLLNKRYGYNANGECALLTEENYHKFNFPAPLSLGIFFDAYPRQDHIDKVKQRAQKFFESVYPKISNKTESVIVEGYRVITHFKYGQEVEV